MANAFTDTVALSGLVQTAYDRLVEFALRAQPNFRAVADKSAAQQAMPGSSVVLSLYNDLGQALTPLTEQVDPDSVAMPAVSTVSVTLNEYGNVALATRKLELFALSDVDPAIANIIAFNMLDTVDELAQTALRAGVNVIRESGGALSTTAATNTITGTDTLKSRDVRFAVAKLRAGKVMPKKGPLYWATVHPEVSLDLRQEVGAGSFRDPHVYSAPDQIWAGEIGTYEGAFFVESPRCYQATDGATSTRVFRSYVAGQQALAEVVADEPHVVIGPIVDKLARFRPIGWLGTLGWSVYRQAAVWRIESTSSIHNT